MKRLLFLIMFVGFSTFAFAQPVEEVQVGEAQGVEVQDVHPTLPGGVLGEILAWLLSAGGVMFIAQLLRGFNINLSGVARTLVGPLLGILAGLISWYWGLVVDFGPIEGALLGTTAAFMFDLGKERGWLASDHSG